MVSECELCTVLYCREAQLGEIMAHSTYKSIRCIPIWLANIPAYPDFNKISEHPIIVANDTNA